MPRSVATSDVFLSFSHHDMALAKRLCSDLETAGFTVWTDGHLAPGTQNWQDAIETAIENCRCMVVVMTPQAKKSKWVRIEVSQAQELDRPIVPLLAAAERKEAILFSLLDVQYLDIRSDYADVVQVSLIPAVQSHLSKRCAEEEKERGDEEREQAQRLDAHKLKLAHEEQEKKLEALKRWQQFQQYLAQGKIAEPQALRNQLDDDCIVGRLADHERIQATVRDLLALAAETQMPSKEAAAGTRQTVPATDCQGIGVRTAGR